MNEHDLIQEQAADLAIKKTAEAQKAIEESRKVQTEMSDERIARSLSVALRDVFGENENSGRFIDTKRIPLICQDLKGMHSSISSIEDNLKWAVRLVLGAVILSLLGLILVNK